MNIVISYCPVCGNNTKCTDKLWDRCGYESKFNTSFNHEWTSTKDAEEFKKELYKKWISKYNYYI